ncbi:hypothetical protein Ais01nite_13390 [Asanoa ishikariensis]|uniref:Uncharacterized protein n=1 Tax=Asanoa ishikariensis TaxID=137265 RepID=A0A1H3SWR7_9ACTN|nr:hypothetical protein [Asanoa ishikariensis]GIF63304.1 hypothetical protein Ais01nite_13390 [Asanoa ishikariensis]SDZ42583.1 hypothetical protein SAMN05421684_4889 [Asanoa ishikariensis]
MTLRAWWDPQWYNCDAHLRVGDRDTFAFYWDEDVAVDDARIGFDPHPERLFRTRPGFDLVFANSVGRAWHYQRATVESIEHATFGPLNEVDTAGFGEYHFRFHDGRWVTLEAEQGPGAVNGTSEGFPVEAIDPDWIHTSGWALVVVLADVTEA